MKETERTEVPRTMRAARMHAVGEPMRIDEIPVPALGPDDVLVQVEAVNIVPNLKNILDNWTTWVPHAPLPTLPATFGLDPVGTIVEVGEHVRKWRVGDRVYVNPARGCRECLACQAGDLINCESFALCGYFGYNHTAQATVDRYPGGLAEYMSAPTYALVRLPDDLEWEAAARFGYIGTMYSALRKANAGPGKSILVNGISGTLGVAAALLAPAFGITALYGTGRNPELLERVRGIAPERIRVHSTEDGPIDEWLLAETGGRGVDVYIDALGPGASTEPFFEGLRSLARGGTVVNVGALMGELPIDVHLLMDEQRSIRGSVWFTAAEGHQMAELVRSGLLDLDVLQHSVSPLDEINEAIGGSLTRANGGFDNFIVAPNR